MRKRRGSPCQVGAGKANASEPLLTRRDEETASKPGYPNNPGTKPGGRPPTGQVVPGVKVARARSAASARNVGRQASIQPRGRAQSRAVVRGSASTGENRKMLSTVVASAGGPARSSDEPPVMRVSHQESVPVEGCDRRRWPGLQRVVRDFQRGPSEQARAKRHSALGRLTALTCRDASLARPWTANPGEKTSITPGPSLAGARLLARWCPA